ncbi:MAG: MarR family transcriptional regulator [Lachnospiraceae bacterium]|nr:MarR family transcriptional regulator [Lachnospiraceae bacterium]
MAEKNSCPGCGRQCDLREPHCGRGEEYRRTGKMSEKRHGKKHCDKKRMEHYHNADMNDKLIINLRDLSHKMRLLYEGKASQKRILMILNESESITQRDLTERLGIQPGSASEILSKLESAGWILRIQNEADRRTTDVCLTDSGRELAAEALAQRQKRHEEMFSCLSAEEKQELLSLLEKVYEDWSVRYGEKEHAHEHGRHPYGRHNGPRRHGGNG